MAIQFRVLGGVVALRDGTPLVLGSARPRSVLAALVLDANKIISLDEVITRVWGDDAPAQARGSVHSYFTRLRTALGASAPIVRRGHGYLLQADPASVDVQRFRSSARLARDNSDRTQALRQFDMALQEWRGRPFADLDSPWLANVGTALEAERESVVLDRTDLRLRLGHHAQLVAELAVQVEMHPLDERLASQFMLALHRSGRQADALFHFQRLRAVLADELGIDPSARLSALYQAILAEDRRLLLPDPHPAEPATGPESPVAGAAGRPGAAAEPIVPRQLPPTPQHFVGRERELAQLSDILTPSGDTTRMGVVSGPGGVGKSSLVLRWAHQHADLFPDGQLFVDLCGFSPSAEPVNPYTAMRGFLLGLQVGPQAIPEDPQAVAGLYRQVLAGRRLLLVLDNAHDAKQVAALMPGSPGCSVVVTSRNRLIGLAGCNQADLLGLDVLGHDDAHTLLSSRLGPGQSTVEAAAREELVAVCGGLPLALSIVVSRAHEHPEFPIPSLVVELHETGSALSILEVDAELSIRAVLATSYAALTTGQAEVFQLLGLVPGPHIRVPAASALTSRPRPAIHALLRELERTSLIQQCTPGCFRMHDLVRLYAREQAEARLSPPERRAALRRLTEFYVHTAVRAAEAAEAEWPRASADPLSPGGEPIALHSYDEARQWIEAENPNTFAALDTAQRLGWHELAGQLTWATARAWSDSAG